jgi:hypothetical protein
VYQHKKYKKYYQAVKPAPFDTCGISESGENYLTVQYEIVPLLIEGIKNYQLRLID